MPPRTLPMTDHLLVLKGSEEDARQEINRAGGESSPGLDSSLRPRLVLSASDFLTHSPGLSICPQRPYHQAAFLVALYSLNDIAQSCKESGGITGYSSIDVTTRLFCFVSRRSVVYASSSRTLLVRMDLTKTDLEHIKVLAEVHTRSK